MNQYEERGKELKSAVKSLLLEFMRSQSDCQYNQNGMKQSQIFRQCGLSWGDYPKATESNQQYWMIAGLKELASENKIEQVSESGPWRLIYQG